MEPHVSEHTVCKFPTLDNIPSIMNCHWKPKVWWNTGL